MFFTSQAYDALIKAFVEHNKVFDPLLVPIFEITWHIVCTSHKHV